MPTGDAIGGAVLLIAVDEIRYLSVDSHVVHLSHGQIRMKPAFAVVEADPNAAVMGYEDTFGIGWIEPDIMGIMTSFAFDLTRFTAVQ